MKAPARLKKGRLIDTIDGVVDTWDWVVNFCKNLAGDGSGATVLNNLSDFPKIAIKQSASDDDDDELPEPDYDDDYELPQIELEPMGLADLGGSAVDYGCWKIGSASSRPALLNRYYAVGGAVREYGPNVFLDDFVLQGTLPEPAQGEAPQEYTDADKPFVALAVSMEPDTLGSAEVVGYKTFSALQQAAANPLKFVKPLYKLTHDGGVAVDFRNLPLAAGGENEI